MVDNAFYILISVVIPPLLGWAIRVYFIKPKTPPSTPQQGASQEEKKETAKPEDKNFFFGKDDEPKNPYQE